MWARAAGALVIGLAIEASPAGAEWETGDDLLRHCSRPMGSRLEALCLGYVTAIADLEKASVVAEDKTFCIPPATTQTQLRDAVVEYLRRNPDKREGRPAAHSVLDAFALSFPCRQ